MRARLTPIVAIALISVVSGVAALEIASRVQPHLVPVEVRTNPPVRRSFANLDQVFEFRRSGGDLNFWMQGKVRPLEPSDDKSLEQIRLVTDGLGFRNPGRWEPRYDIVALGDSFTYGNGAPRPWPERLAELAGSSVLNLGQPAIGTLEERDIFLQFGRDKSARWVLLAYFEGNDLYDIGEYARARPLIAWRLATYHRARAQRWVQDRLDEQGRRGGSPAYLYPVQLSVARQQYELVFWDVYLRALTMRGPDIEASQNARLLVDAWTSMRSAVESPATRFLVIYIPSKEHLLVPEVHAAGALEPLIQDLRTVVLDRNGYLGAAGSPVEATSLLASLDEQAKAVERLARSTGMDFVDLTPCFRASLARGDLLYYEFDTHWTQAGQDMAAGMVAEYLRSNTVAC